MYINCVFTNLHSLSQHRKNTTLVDHGLRQKRCESSGEAIKWRHCAFRHACVTQIFVKMCKNPRQPPRNEARQECGNEASSCAHVG